MLQLLPFPTALLGYTEIQARDYCRDLISTTRIEAQCKGVVSLEVEKAIIASCVTDIQVRSQNIVMYA